MDALLARLYRPIVFPGLAAANPAVRANALALLLDAFPLQACACTMAICIQLHGRCCPFCAAGDARCMGCSVPPT